MTKRERIAALERKVADFEARIAAAEARLYVWPHSIPAQPLPSDPIWVGDSYWRIVTTPCSGGTVTVGSTAGDSCGIGWRTQ